MFSRLRDVFKAATGRLGSISILTNAWEEGQAVYPDHNFENYVREGYSRNELIYSCIELFANTASATDLLIKSPSGKVLPDHPLARLMAMPNPFVSGFEFWSLTITFLKLAGAAYWLKVYDGAGQPTQLWPLRPDKMAAVKDSQKFIVGYEYSSPGGVPVKLPTQDILAFVKRSPLDLALPFSPIQVAARAADVDNRMTDYLNNMARRGMRPMGVFASKLKLMQTDIDRLLFNLEKRYGGTANWDKPLVLDSDASFQRTGLTNEELAFDALDARNECRICMIMHVPPIMVGAKAGLDKATYSNYGEARTSFWQDSVVPLYRFLDNKVETQLLPDFDDRLLTERDYSRTPALTESLDARWARATEALKAGGLTVNEFCKEVGLPDKGPAGDVYVRTIQQVTVPVGQPDANNQAAAAASAQQTAGDYPAPSVKAEAPVRDEARYSEAEREALFDSFSQFKDLSGVKPKAEVAL